MGEYWSIHKNGKKCTLKITSDMVATLAYARAYAPRFEVPVLTWKFMTNGAMSESKQLYRLSASTSSVVLDTYTIVAYNLLSIIYTTHKNIIAVLPWLLTIHNLSTTYLFQ